MPEDERDEPEVIAKKLHVGQAGACSLCDGPINLASDSYEADHDVPESEEGETCLANLRLAHMECNRAKRSSATGDIRPYLRLKRYLAENGGRLRYDGVLPHFEIEPKPVAVLDNGDPLVLQLPDGTELRSPVFEETVDGANVRYTYAQLPTSAIFNDEEVQPRAIKLDHAHSIYLDLHRNPLHEPPSCRLDTSGASAPILMFDGQHKSVANWMLGRSHVVAKIYLDMATEEATELVNSIQARIKKLPLSAFELAGKMSDEYKHKIKEYEEHCVEANITPSETGFISWLPSDDRSRARTALESAILQSILDDDDLRLLKHVKYAGSSSGMLNETTVRNKILKPMVHTKAVDVSFDESAQWRDTERDIVVRIVNHVVDTALDDPDGPATPSWALRRERLKYQSALSYFFFLARDVYRQVMVQSTTDSVMGDMPSADQWKQIESALSKMLDHPVWTAPDESAGMEPVLDAFSKNQNAKTAFESVGLDLGYAITGKSSNTKKLEK